MKTAFSTFAPAVCAAALFAGCAEKSITGPQKQDPVRSFSTAEEHVSHASTAFGLELLRRLHGTESAPNLLISPLSASMALGMTMNGAVGPTYDAMRTTLGFGDLPEAEVNAAYRGLISQLNARTGGRVEFRLANSVWYERTFQVKAPFIETVRGTFDAEVEALDFSSPAAPGIISGWAEQKTGGRIKDLVERIDPLDRMILVNAVYFKAPWAHPFEPNATRNGPFTRADGQVISVPLMSLDHSLPHVRNSEVHMVELPYADTAFSMVIAAPAQGSDLSAMIAQLTPSRWEAWIDQLSTGRVMLTLPKFRFEYDIAMKPVLSQLGMGIAFAPGAGFTRIADHDDLHISQVRQKAFIDVHELGTEAAAATSVTMSLTSMPPELRFDRPFIFVIRERSSGTLLFLGRVGAP